MRMTASVGSMVEASGTSWMRTSPTLNMTVARVAQATSAFASSWASEVDSSRNASICS
jgi:hypothetical protein